MGKTLGLLSPANAGVLRDKRINFHVGDLMMRAGDMSGDGVNIAARAPVDCEARRCVFSGGKLDQVLRRHSARRETRRRRQKAPRRPKLSHVSKLRTGMTVSIAQVHVASRTPIDPISNSPSSRMCGRYRESGEMIMRRYRFIPHDSTGVAGQERTLAHVSHAPRS